MPKHPGSDPESSNDASPKATAKGDAVGDVARRSQRELQRVRKVVPEPAIATNAVWIASHLADKIGAA